MMIFSKTSPETLPMKKLKNPEINPKTWCVNEKLLNNSGMLYIVRKVIKRRIQW